MSATCNCPKCGRFLQRSGLTTVDGQTVALNVFQCDECLDSWEVEGESFETALTFALDADGNCLDPETLHPLDLSRYIS